MSGAKPVSLVTANRLRDGVPVYYAGAGWSPALSKAVLLAGEAEAEALLARLLAVPPPQVVVAPYLIEAEPAPGAPRPVSLRERIRANGPTV